MTTLEVDIADLQAFASEMTRLSAALRDAGGLTPHGAGSGADAVEDALREFRSRWTSGLRLLCDDLEEVAGKVKAAADVYDSTERQLIDSASC